MTQETTIRLRAVQPVQYARKRHMPGAVFAADEETAEALIAGGDAVSDEGEGAPEPEANAGKDNTGTGDPGGGQDGVSDAVSDAGNDSERQAALVAAIALLEPGREDRWTKAGKPEIRALEAASGLSGISAAERDEAWDIAQARDPESGQESDQGEGTGGVGGTRQT